jgi:hypothetical protein
MSVPTSAKLSTSSSGNINKPSATATATATATVKSSTANSKFSVNPLWSTIGTTIQFAFALFCIYLAPFGRSSPISSASSFINQLYDLLFTENLRDYAQVQRGASYIGPALLATVLRPLSLIFDDRVRLFLFDKVLPRVGLSDSVISQARLVIIETRFWNYLAARVILAAAFVFSLSILRHSMAQKFKSASLPRIFTALSLASAVPLLSASALQVQTFSIILFNLALAAIISGKFTRAFSLLTVNFIIFDFVNGSVLLISTFLVSLLFLENFNAFKSLASIILTLPVAVVINFAFDSLFYNKFIWPQGDLFWSLNLSKETVISHLIGLFNSFVSNLKAFDSETLLKSKLLINLVISLSPALAVYIFGRSNRYTRALLSLYTSTVSFNLIFLSGNLSSACTPMTVPLLVATSISVLGGIKSSNRLVKSSTYLLFLGLILPGLFWSVGRLHLDISAAQQFTGKALMALNSKILKESREGVPTRVHIDAETATYGYSRFMELSRNAIYTSGAKAQVRSDYFVGPQAQCPESKALKLFQGFQKVDLKTLQVASGDRIGVFRATATCPTTDSPVTTSNSVVLESENEISQTAKLISLHLLKGQFSSLKDQRDFIANHLGKFNHKKISNSVAIIAYLYANLLEQI